VTDIVKAPPAGPRQWLGLAVLTAPTMLAMLDLNVVILALPRLSADVSASSTQSLWITDIYGFLIAGFLVGMGRVGDRVGHRRLLFIGAAAFGVLSLLAAYSSSAAELIAVRALLGVAGATLMPSILALIKHMFPDKRQMSTAMAVWSTAMMAGIAFGPALGGLLLSRYWWGSIFLIGVPVMALLLIAGPLLLPETGGGRHARLDASSVALSLLALLPIIYGLTELARSGWAVPPAVAMVVGVVCAVIFARRQVTLPDPLLDLDLFKIPAIGGALVLYLGAGALQGGTGFLMTQHLQLVEGYTPLRTALWLLVPTVVVVAGIQLSVKTAKRVRPVFVLCTGALVAAVGMAVLTQVRAGGLTVLIVGLCVLFLGTSSVPVLCNQLVMQAAPPDRAGSAASLTTTAGDLGTAVGIAFLGSLSTLLYHRQLSIPAAVPAGDGRAAHESLARAAATARSLPGPLGDALLAAARDAFNAAFNTATGICAVLFVGLAVFVSLTMRRVQPIGDLDEHAAPATTRPDGAASETSAAR
jgi:DHA2 family multidrug resistance protein-like MFS transporter